MAVPRTAPAEKRWVDPSPKADVVETDLQVLQEVEASKSDFQSRVLGAVSGSELLDGDDALAVHVVG